MMPIKIRCGCGQKYAFDVEPIDGVMGYAVQCPVCGAAGTAIANGLIAERLGAPGFSAPALRLGGRDPVSAAHPPVPRSLPFPAPAPRSPGVKVRRIRLLQAACGGVVLILVGAVVLGHSVGLSQKSGGVVAAEKGGFPHTLAELNAWYVEPPDGQNAGVFFSEGIKVLHLANVESSSVPLLGKGKLPPLGSPLSASAKSALTSLIRSNRDMLQFFAQGARYEHSRYPVDLSLGVEAAFPHLGKMKEAGQVIELAAVLHAESNDAKAAANDLSLALALAGSLRAEPNQHSQFVRTRLVALAMAGLEQGLNRAAWPAQELAEILRLLQNMEAYDARGEGFSRGVIGERVTAITLLGRPDKFLELLPVLGVDISAERRAQMVARLQSGTLQSEERYYDQALIRLMTARQQAFPDRLKSDDLIRQEVTDAATKQFVLAEFLLSGLRNVASKEAECLAYLRLGLAATALEQFRIAHDNRYPATLSELTPGPLACVPTDPYDGQPLRYKPKSDGYLLYSIGPDLKDKFGQRLSGKQGNIVFEVVTPANAPR